LIEAHLIWITVDGKHLDSSQVDTRDAVIEEALDQSQEVAPKITAAPDITIGAEDDTMAGKEFEARSGNQPEEANITVVNHIIGTLNEPNGPFLR